MLNKGALRKAGWTPALVAAVLGRPDQVEQHAKGYKRWTEHLYSEAHVRSGEGDPRFVEATRRRRARAAAAEFRRAEIPTKYVSWRAGLADAAEGLFSLNRYAKHRTCAAPHRVEIYGLKNEFIQMLYENGYCTRSWIHRLELAEQKCRECGGDGGGDFDCEHCGGSGIWRAARTVEFWCFRFAVGGKTYCWHQPRGSVKFAPEESVAPEAWEGLSGEKPVALAKQSFALAKALLRWAIDAAAGDQAGRTAPEAAAIPFEFAGPASPSSPYSAGAQTSMLPF